MPVRVVTINMWGDREPLATRLQVAASQLAALAPDVILVQEVRRNAGQPTTADDLAGRLGMQAHYAPATIGPAGTWGPGSQEGEEGLAILTRHPLDGLTARELPEARPNDRRILLSGRVTIAGHTLGVHTTHLHWRLGDGLAREQQVQAIDAMVRAEKGVQIIGGDFNAAPDTDELRFMRGLTTLGGRRAVWQDAWLARHPEDASGWTWARANPQTAWLAHLALDRRIDFLFVSPEQKSGAGRIVTCERVLDQAIDGVLASDHFGVMAEVELG